MINRNKLWILIAVAVLVLCAFTVSSGDDSKVAFFSNLNIGKDDVVDGDAVAIFGNVNVEGTIKGDVAAIFGTVKVDGTLDGDVAAVMGAVKVGPHGIVGGDAAGIGGGVKKAPGGIIKGETADVAGPFSGGSRGWIPAVTAAKVIGLALSFLFSALVVLIIPDKLRYMANDSLRDTGRRIGIGFLAYLLFIPIIIALAITIIGILVIPFFIFAFFLVIFIGMVAVQVAIGQKLTGKQEAGNTLYINLLIGIVIMFAIQLVPILGWLAYLVVTAGALGIVIDTRLGSPSRLRV